MHIYRRSSSGRLLGFRPMVVGLIFISIQLQTALAEWKRHVVFEGASNQTAIAGDYTKDGRPDVITSAGGKTRLLVAPDWKEIHLAEHADHDAEKIMERIRRFRRILSMSEKTARVSAYSVSCRFLKSPIAHRARCSAD